MRFQQVRDDRQRRGGDDGVAGEVPRVGQQRLNAPLMHVQPRDPGCGKDLSPLCANRRRQLPRERREPAAKLPALRRSDQGAFSIRPGRPLQYGLGIRAFVLNLLVAQMVSLKRVQQLLNTLIERLLSQATLLGYVLQLHRAIEAIKIIPRYGGVIIHDCWASYLSYEHCGHGLRGAHLLRELTFVIEANGYRWAANMKRLLLETRKQVVNSPHKCLSEDDYLKLTKRYRVILARGAKELPPIPPRQDGKRGRLAKSDAHNLWERFERHEAAVLLFAKRPEVAIQMALSGELYAGGGE